MNNTLIGIIGMVAILMAFLLNIFSKKFNSETLTYGLLNVIGSGLLIYYSIKLSSIPFLILNIVWFFTAIFKSFKLGYE